MPGNSMDRPLRFHWSLSQAGDKFRRAQATTSMPGVVDLAQLVDTCRHAETCGIESMLMAIGFTRPDPLALAVAIGLRTEKIKFMVACRSGLISPTFFVQQINTASALVPGRVLVNIVCGHTPHELRYYGDFLPHDERYARTNEFLTICRALWHKQFPYSFRGKYFQIEDACIHTPFMGREGPEIFAGGNSAEAADLAIRHASCLWRFPDAPEKLEGQAGPVLHLGTPLARGGAPRGLCFDRKFQRGDHRDACAVRVACGFGRLSIGVRPGSGQFLALDHALSVDRSSAVSGCACYCVGGVVRGDCGRPADLPSKRWPRNSTPRRTSKSGGCGEPTTDSGPRAGAGSSSASPSFVITISRSMVGISSLAAIRDERCASRGTLFTCSMTGNTWHSIHLQGFRNWSRSTACPSGARER